MSKMMEKVMSGMMKPEDMPKMMDSMMSHMFESMSVEDRIEFVTTMMPKCLNILLSEVDGESRIRLAKGMLDNLAGVRQESQHE
ncbi:hypothetical protein D2Q93_11315 [Alicyclobacillaceae bacterium I2511]|nr:hypothetical protein D2Q93_11315 [Alicyclobacillaceae bacterium I2511]